MTLISRILGFVRDMAIARYFGADAATDAFFAAFRIPNFLRRLFAEGSFAQAFVPLAAESRESGGMAGMRAFLARASGSLAWVLFLASLAGALAAPLLILAFAPGFRAQPEQFELAGRLLRICFPYLLFVTLTALAGGALNALGRFAIPAVTPALLNVAMIASAVWLAPLLAEPIEALAWGVLLGGIAQLGLQIPALARAGLLARPRVEFRDPGVRALFARMGPAIFGVSVTQVNLLMDTLIASFLSAGSVSWLYYSDRLVEFPLGVFGVALGASILPHLAKTHARGDAPGFSRALDWGLRWVLLIGAPATAGLTVLSTPLMSTLFQYDEFGGRDVEMAGRSLTTYSSGLIGFIAVKVLASGFGARHDARTPARLGLYAMLANLLLCLLLTYPLAGIGWGHAALALATALAAWVNAGLLLHRLRADRVYVPEAGWFVFGCRILLALAAMVWLLRRHALDLPWQGWSAEERVLRLAFWIAAGGAVYFACLWASGMRARHLSAGGK